MRLVLLVVFLGGCIESDLIPCGDVQCPADTVCGPDGRCLAPELLEQCQGMPDGEACDALEGIDGRCATGVCEQVSCGNGFIDDQLHEACDGATAAQCVDFGFDLGRPACTSCAIDTSTCVRFGWVRLEYASSQDMWTDGTITAYTTYSPQGLIVHGGGFAVDETDRYFRITGGGGRVFGLRGAELVELVGTGPVPVTHPTYQFFMDVAVGDDGVVYALAGQSGCTIVANTNGTWEEIGTAQPIPEGRTCYHLDVDGAGAATRIVVSDSTSRFYWNDGRTRFVAGPVLDFSIAQVRADGDAVWLNTEMSLWRFDLTTQELKGVLHPATDVTSFALVGDRVYATTNDGLILRVADGRIDRFRGPTGGRVTDDGRGGLYMYNGPIYRFTGTTFGEMPTTPIDVLDEQLVGSCRRGKLLITAAERHVFVLTGDAWEIHESGLQPTSVQSLACNADSVVLASSVENDNAYLARWDTDGSHDLLRLDSLCEAVWLAPDGALIGVGASGVGDAADTSPGWIGETRADALGDPGALVEHVLPVAVGACRLVAVHGDGAGKVVAAGRCDGKGTILERTALQSWNVIYQSPTIDGGFRAVATHGGKIFAAGDRGAAWFDGTTWHADASVIGRTLSGTADDMWLSGAFTNVQHFDGTAWSQVATAALTRIVVSAGDESVVFPGGAPGHVNLIRDRQIVPP